MPFGLSTQEFDHLQFLPVLERMYRTNRVDEIKNYASFSQVDRFRKELETLEAFGLHKQLDIRLDQSQEEKTAARKLSDGKVDTIICVSKAKIQETYRDGQNKKCYRRKIRHAFIESTVFRTNQTLFYDGHHPPHCLNCGGQMEAESENYFCPYCQSRYQAEAYEYKMARFFIEGAFHHFQYALLFLLPIFVIAFFQAKGIIGERQIERFSYAGGLLISFLLCFALVKGLLILFRHQTVLHKIKSHDPHFSGEIFTMHLIDLFTIHPEILISTNESNKGSCGIICRNVRHLQFRRYERKNDQEIVECIGKVDALYLNGNPGHVHLRDKETKITIHLARRYGTLTPVHYLPDQFTCPNCGSHQISDHDGIQVCQFCRTELPMDTIDWVLYPL